MNSSHPPILINKKPILDASNNVIAFQLSLEVLDEKFLADENIEGLKLSIQQLYADIEKSGGFVQVTDDKPVYFSAPSHLYHSDLLPNLPKETLFLEFDEDVIGNTECLKNIKELVTSGYRFVLKNYKATEKQQKLLQLAKGIKVSIQNKSIEEIKTLIADLHDDVEIIITQVDTEERFNELMSSGFKKFQGYYFTEPVLLAADQVDTGSLAILQLLAELSDPEIEFQKIVNLVQSDVTLSHKLLTAINHPSNNLAYKVDTLKDAVSFMGLKKLKFWVQMMALSDVKNVPNELLVTALIRANFLQAIAQQTGKESDQDTYFLVGLFSTLNAFMKIPMVDIVKKLPVSDVISQALTSQQGAMGKVLFIAKAMEQGNTQMISLGHEGLGLMQISASYIKASGWAHQTVSALKA